METLSAPSFGLNAVPSTGTSHQDAQLRVLERLAAAIEHLARVLADASQQGASLCPTPAGLSRPVRDDGSSSDAPLQERPTLLDFLGRRGFTVQSMALPTDEAEPMNRLAWFLGSRFASLRSQLRKIKVSMNNGLRFTLDLAEATDAELSNNCQFATLAREQGLLQDCQYVRQPRRALRVVCNRSPEALNFFSGGWLERYLEESLRRTGPFIVDLQRNTAVTLPTGEDFELDLLALDCRGQVLWVEAKSGEYTGHLPKYARVRQMLNLPIDRAVLVLPEVQDAACRALRTQYGLHAVNLSGWSRLLTELAPMAQ